MTLTPEEQEIIKKFAEKVGEGQRKELKKALDELERKYAA